MAWLRVQHTLTHDVTHSLAACPLHRHRSIALAAQPGQLPDAKMLALFSMGALVSLRGGGADEGAEARSLIIPWRGFVVAHAIPCADPAMRPRGEVAAAASIWTSLHMLRMFSAHVACVTTRGALTAPEQALMWSSAIPCVAH